MSLPMTLVSQATGIPEQTLYTWVRRGILTDSEKLEDYTKAIVKYYKKQLKEALDKKSNGQNELQTEKTRLTKEQANKLEIENEIRAGELIEAAEVEKTWVNGVMACKSRLLAIPNNVSDRIATIEDPLKIQNILETEVFEALEELSKGIAQNDDL